MNIKPIKILLYIIIKYRVNIHDIYEYSRFYKTKWLNIFHEKERIPKLKGKVKCAPQDRCVHRRCPENVTCLFVEAIEGAISLQKKLAMQSSYPQHKSINSRLK